jgi:sulfite reductase (NADPH) hemoprotein beta-component
VFHRLGDYKHKQRNRLKFLIKNMGWEAWKAAFEREWAAIRAEGDRSLSFDPDRPAVETEPDWERAKPASIPDTALRAALTPTTGPGFQPRVRTSLTVIDGQLEAWAATNVARQKQKGYATATITLPLGDLTSAQMRVVADLAEAYADGTVRLTVEQNIVLRWVPEKLVPELHRQLVAAGLGEGGAGTAADVVSCPGAEACRLAVTQSRGLGRVLSDHLLAHPELTAGTGALKLKVSGCPNGCGQHHVADLGFQGSVRQLGGRAVPQYFVMVGGGAHGSAHFGRLAAKIPARRMPEAVERLIALWRAEGQGQSAPTFFRTVAMARVKAALADLEALTVEGAAPEDYVDLGEQGEFKVETMAGECAT